MSRESRARWPRASAGLAKWSPPERRAPRSIGSGKRPLVFSDDADDDALYDYIALVDHGVAAHLQDVAAAAARQELVRDGNRLVAGDGLDRMAGGNESQERQLGRPGL